MAFPTSPISFTIKNNGDDVLPAHVNDLQTEITAIETGWLTGTARLNAGASTLGSLSTPLSTIAALTANTLSVTGGSTLASLSVNGSVNLGITTSQTQPRCFVYNNAAQLIADVTATALTFNTEVEDVGAMHDTGSNTSRITIPSGGDGFYLLVGAASFAAATSGARQLYFRKNGGQAYPGFIVTSAAIVGAQVHLMISLAAGDYMELVAVQNSGGAMNIGAASLDSANTVQAVKLW